MLLKVSKVVKETPDSVTIRFDKKIKFQPGEFVAVELEINGERVRRFYSLASSPYKNYFEICIKEIPRGKASLYLTNKTKVGDKIEVKDPIGTNFLLDDSYKKITLISAGSGITPFRCFIQYIIDKKLKTKVILLNSNKTPRDIIYRKELEELNKRPNITVINTITRADTSKEKWTGLTGRIDLKLIKKHNKKLDGIFYICGSPTFVKEMSEILLKAKVPVSHIKRELHA